MSKFKFTVNHMLPLKCHGCFRNKFIPFWTVTCLELHVIDIDFQIDRPFDFCCEAVEAPPWDGLVWGLIRLVLTQDCVYKQIFSSSCSSSWLNFVNKDLWRKLSMSTADILMADKTDAGQASPAAVTAVENLVWYGCWGFLDLPPVAFLPEVGSVGVLRDNLVDGVAPGLTVSSNCRPLVVVNVAGTKSLLERVFENVSLVPLCHSS